MTATAEQEKFMVVAFTEHQRERRLLRAWPQHLTILPWMVNFRRAATTRISDVVEGFGPIELHINGKARLGGGKVPVWTVEKTAEIEKLHQLVLQEGPKNDTVLIAPTHTGDNYLPHITRHAGQPELAVGERLTISEISIIGHHATGKMVFENIPLI